MTSFCFSWKLFHRIKIPESGIMNRYSPPNWHARIWTYPVINVYIHASFLCLRFSRSHTHTCVCTHTQLHSLQIFCTIYQMYLYSDGDLLYEMWGFSPEASCQHGKCNILHHFSLCIFSMVVVSCFSPQALPRVVVHPAWHQKLCMHCYWQLPPGFCPSQSSVCFSRTGA